MFLGFQFDPIYADTDCNQWLENSDDINMEHLETQRASIANMLKLPHLLSKKQEASLQKAETMIYNYLCDNGGISSPVLRDEALGGDLLQVNFDLGHLSHEVERA